MHQVRYVLSGCAIVTVLLAGQVYAKGTIEGKILVFPSSDVTISLSKKNWMGLSKSYIAEVTTTKNSSHYRFTDLAPGSYELEFKGPYILKGAKTVRVEEYSSIDMTKVCQPYLTKASIIGLLYAKAFMDPGNFPKFVSDCREFITVHPDLTDCMQKAGAKMIGRSMTMDSEDAYGRAVELWQPGMPTNIPGDIAREVRNASLEMYEMGKNILALKIALPDLLDGKTSSYYESDLYKRNIQYLQIWNVLMQTLRSQYQQLEQQRIMTAQLLGIDIPPSPELQYLRPEVLNSLRFTYSFAQIQMLISVVCP